MNYKQKSRLTALIFIFLLIAGAAFLVLYALKKNINLFYTPTELAQVQVSSDRHIRLGGYVKNKSVQYDISGKTVNFVVTDHSHDIHVNFDGVLPNLFREGQVVVMTGQLDGNRIFKAQEVLAKHDEKYMPKQLAKDLQKKPSRGSYDT